MFLLLLCEFIAAALVAYLVTLSIAKMRELVEWKADAYWKTGSGVTLLTRKGNQTKMTGLLLHQSSEMLKIGDSVFLRTCHGSNMIKGHVAEILNNEFILKT